LYRHMSRLEPNIEILSMWRLVSAPASRPEWVFPTSDATTLERL
jgi:hypothetical protein